MGLPLQLLEAKAPEASLLSPLTSDQCLASLEWVTPLFPWHWEEHIHWWHTESSVPGFTELLGVHSGSASFRCALCCPCSILPPPPGNSTLSPCGHQYLCPTLHGQLPLFGPKHQAPLGGSYPGTAYPCQAAGVLEGRRGVCLYNLGMPSSEWQRTSAYAACSTQAKSPFASSVSPVGNRAK